MEDLYTHVDWTMLLMVDGSPNVQQEFIIDKEIEGEFVSEFSKPKTHLEGFFATKLFLTQLFFPLNPY